MILDALSNAGLYRSLGSRIAAGFDYLESADRSLPVGRYPIDGDDVFALVQGYDTGPATEKRLETHRRYIDIQFVAAGTERIIYAPLEGLEIDTDYNTENDISFYRDPAASSSLLLTPGHFAIFFPEDAHKPGCMAGGRESITKILVKLRV